MKVQQFKVRLKTTTRSRLSLTRHADKSSCWAE